MGTPTQSARRMGHLGMRNLGRSKAVSLRSMTTLYDETVKDGAPGFVVSLSVGNGSFGLAVGDGFAGGVGDGDFAAVGGFDGVVGEGPVFCVGDGAGGGGFDVEVVEAEVVECGVGVGADVEGLFGAGGLDVPDVDIAEVGQPFLSGTGVVRVIQ